MRVGDSAEEFISIHALQRERLLMLSCGFPSHPLRILFFARWETIEFLAQFSTDQPPNELPTFRVYDAVVDFVERSVWRTRNCATSNPRSA